MAATANGMPIVRAGEASRSAAASKVEYGSARSSGGKSMAWRHSRPDLEDGISTITYGQCAVARQGLLRRRGEGTAARMSPTTARP